MNDDAWRPELSPSLRQLWHPDLDPLFWSPERRGAFSAWWGHVPFAHWIMRAIRPRVMVELGTHWGVSYAAFCHAALRCRLNTRCFAVDTWKGDPHASFYEEEVFEDFRAFHDERYTGFSTLLRCTFDEALERIEDGSVDLLHLDGLHAYDAVKHDFQSWLPKLSSRGVALLHDIDVHRDDFGVWQLWQELREQHPHFEFHHCYGLGVLALGKDVPHAISELCAVNASEEGATLRNRIAAIGERGIAEAHRRELRAELTRQQQAYVVETEAMRQAYVVETEATRQAYVVETEAARSRAVAAAHAADVQRMHLEEALGDAEKNRRAANAEAELRRARTDELQCQNAAFERSLAEQRSTFERNLAEQRSTFERNLAEQRSTAETQRERNLVLQLAVDRLQAIDLRDARAAGLPGDRSRPDERAL